MSDGAIRDAVRMLAGTHLKDGVYMASCSVESVDVPNRQCTCTLIDGKVDNEITADLMCGIDDGFFINPTIGSTVKVIFSDYVPPFVCQYSEIDNIILRGGDLGGLVKVVELTEKLNTLENQMNELKTLIASWAPVPNDGGAALKATLTNWVAEEITLTEQAEIENTNITHG